MKVPLHARSSTMTILVTEKIHSYFLSESSRLMTTPIYTRPPGLNVMLGMLGVKTLC